MGDALKKTDELQNEISIDARYTDKKTTVDDTSQCNVPSESLSASSLNSKDQSSWLESLKALIAKNVLTEELLQSIGLEYRPQKPKRMKADTKKKKKSDTGSKEDLKNVVSYEDELGLDLDNKNDVEADEDPDINEEETCNQDFNWTPRETSISNNELDKKRRTRLAKKDAKLTLLKETTKRKSTRKYTVEGSDDRENNLKPLKRKRKSSRGKKRKSSDDTEKAENDESETLIGMPKKMKKKTKNKNEKEGKSSESYETSSENVRNEEGVYEDNDNDDYGEDDDDKDDFWPFEETDKTDIKTGNDNQDVEVDDSGKIRSAKTFTCPYCPKSFKGEKCMKNHAKLCPKSPSPALFYCEICSRTFTRKVNLTTHIKRVHLKKWIPKKPEKVLCQICSATLSKTCFKKHMERHQGKTKPCRYCTKPFATIEDTKRHENTCAKNPQPDVFYCEHCPKSFNNKNKLKYHLQMHDPDGRRFQCDICGAKFFKKQIWEKHVSYHSDVRPFHCKHCPSSFKIKRHLKTHELIHNESERYTCPLCPNRKFIQYGNLKIHMKVHEKEGVFIAGIMPKMRPNT